jgi:Transposase domain (DUF772)
MLLIGYFEGLDSERGIAWRVADSLSRRQFLGYALDEQTPDHTTVSRTRRLFWLETHKAVFRWVLKILIEEGLVPGRTISIDATTLEANAALRSIVRRDSGQGYNEYRKELAQAVGIENPTREQRARLDRKRKKKGSHEEWKHPKDPEARITKMKDGRTHLAYQAEHAVDLASGAVLAVTVRIYRNRRRVRREKSKRLPRRRGELSERSFAHLYDSGGRRRVYLRSRDNILKRVLVQAGAFNLGLVMRNLFGAGTPRQLPDAGTALEAAISYLVGGVPDLIRTLPR